MREIRLITHDPVRRNRVRLSIYGLESVVDAVTREVLDPNRAERALELCAELVLVVSQEAEVPR